MMRLAILALLGLGACAAPQPGPDLRATLTRAQLDAIPGPLLFVEVEERGAGALLRPIAQNGVVTTWEAADGVTVALQRGVLVATRGLGFDLMSADVGAVRAAIARGGGSDYPRLMSYLDGENQIVFRAFRCVMTTAGREAIDSFGLARATTRLDETCYSLADPVVNTYWTGADGTIWRARQWVGAEAGHIVTETVRQ